MAPKGTGSYAGRVGWSVGLATWLDSDASKVSRYWRSIEYGNNTWVGQRIVGLWGNDPGPNTRPGKFRNGDLSRMGEGGSQKFVPFFKTRNSDMAGAAKFALGYYFGVTGGKVSTANRNLDELTVDTKDSRNRRPARDRKGNLTGKTESRGSGAAAKRRALFMLLQAAGEGKKVPFVVGDVAEGIEARHFYNEALSRFNPAEEELAALRAEFGRQFRSIPGFDAASTSGRKAIRTRIGDDSVYGRARGGRARGSANRGNIGGYDPATNSYSGGYFGNRAGIVTIAAGVQVQDYLQAGRGFSTMQDAVRAVNEEVSRRFQDELVAVMSEASRKRKPTGDLLRAHSDRRNRYP